MLYSKEHVCHLKIADEEQSIQFSVYSKQMAAKKTDKNNSPKWHSDMVVITHDVTKRTTEANQPIHYT